MSSTPDPAAVLPGSQHTVTIDKLSFGGSGIAKVGTLTVFVPDSLPGQHVEITITKRKDTYAEGQVKKVVRKAKDEIPARCAHFQTCGGCIWQTLPYNKQIEYKEDIVRETLTHLTPIDDAARQALAGRVLKIIPSPQVFNYRNKMEFSFGYTSMRTEEKGGRRLYFDEGPTVGFHQPGKWETVIPISECHLYDEQTPMLLQDVKRFMEATRIPVYNPKTGKGMLRTLLLRRGVHTNEQMICFVMHARKKELEPLFQHFLRAFSGRPNLASLMIVEHLGLHDRPEFPKVHTLVGKPSISERLFDLTFEISPFSFFQTNTLAAEKLYKAIADAADLNQRDTVLDLYCGMGTIGQYLARYCQKVVGVESHPTAVDDALKSAGRNRIANISFYKGRAEQVMEEQLKAGGKYAFDVIVVDPPRAGLHPKALRAVIEHKAKKVVYVSCNTATFARDLGEFLKAGYELRTVQPVDLFPHTAHIETVALLQLKS